MDKFVSHNIFHSFFVFPFCRRRHQNHRTKYAVSKRGRNPAGLSNTNRSFQPMGIQPPFEKIVVCPRALSVNLLPKQTFPVLWGIALLRLLIPFSIPSALSVYSLTDRHIVGRTVIYPVNQLVGFRLLHLFFHYQRMAHESGFRTFNRALFYTTLNQGIGGIHIRANCLYLWSDEGVLVCRQEAKNLNKTGIVLTKG